MIHIQVTINFSDPSVKQFAMEWIVKEIQNGESETRKDAVKENDKENVGKAGRTWKEGASKDAGKEGASKDARKEGASKDARKEGASKDDAKEGASKDAGKEDGEEKSKDLQFHYWTEKEEKMLVETRSSLEEEFSSTKSHNTLWQKVKGILAENNIYVTIKQAQDKWKNLKKKYKEVEDNNNRSGRSKQTCKYQDTFNNLYGTRPSTRPLCVIDTDKAGPSNVDANPTDTKPPPSKRMKIESKSPRGKLVDMMKETAQKNEEFKQELREHQRQKLQ
jgi:hypothetical protein